LVGALYYSAFITYLLASHILRWNFSKGLSSNPPGGTAKLLPPSTPRVRVAPRSHPRGPPTQPRFINVTWDPNMHVPLTGPACCINGACPGP